MTVRDKIANGFGQILASASDLDSLDERMAVQRAALVEAVIHGRRKPAAATQRYVALWAAGAAAACALVLVIAEMPTDSISFYSGGSSEALPEGHFIRTTDTGGETIRFDGGHRFDFSADTKARVVKSSAGEVIVDVEKGGVLANVVPGSGIAWTVRAGPYEVSVKGTVFRVDWDESNAVLFVSVDRGKVAVHGPGTDAEGVFVSAGKLLRADTNHGRVTLGRHEKKLASSESQEDAAPAPSTDAPENIKAPEDTEGANTWADTDVNSGLVPRRAAAVSDWKTMYAARDFKGILALAEKKGIDGLKRRLGRDELWIVANSARYARNRQVADALFNVFRERFPNSPQSQTAAFLLAKSAWERGNVTAAKQWFEVYAHEAPEGPLAEEALGRLIQIYQKLGNRIAAVRSAESYLAKYEGGYFTKQARAAVRE